MSPNNPTGVLPSTAYDFYYPTILLTLDVSELAYETYSSSGSLVSSQPTDPSESTLLAAGWTQIQGASGEENDTDNYQGVAFYKVVDGVTEVVIGNRGTQSGNLLDYASDAAITVNAVPAVDGDALTYYNGVVAWLNNPANGVSGPVNIIETGHSLGGQEADYVEVLTTIRGAQFSTEAVTFNAPGIATSVVQGHGSLKYNALNISVSNELVHVGGSVFNAGYKGSGVSIDSGTPIAPYAVELIVGTLAGGLGLSSVLANLGGGGLAYYGLVSNHKTDVLNAYFAEHPALGGVNLQTYAADVISQSAVDNLANISAATYANDTVAQKASLYATMIGSGSTSSSSTGSADETFTESVQASTVVLTGSNGDVITINNAVNTVATSDNHGNSDTLTFSADGTALVSEAWTDADGSKGTETFNPIDGSSTSKITYASGGYATILDDAQGNITTDYFTKSGNEYAYSWVHSDGTSGEETIFSNGLTTLGGGSLNVPSSAYETLTNPDGSYSTYSYNPADAFVSQRFSSAGSLTSTTSGQVGGQNFNRANLDPVTTENNGNIITLSYDGTGDLVSDTWTNSAGVSGSDTYNASGAVSGQTNNLDGTSSTYTLYPSAGGLLTTYTPPSSPVPISVAGPYSLTTDQFGQNGILTSDQWQLADGAHGQDTFARDGSGTGSITHADGSTSSITVDSSGDIIVDNLTGNSNVTSEDWWGPNGTHGTDLYSNNQVSSAYSFNENGVGQETTYASDGTVASRETISSGAYLSADGSQFGEILNANGSYSVDYSDSNGDAVIFDYSTGGVLLGTDHLSATPVSGFSGVLSNGQAWTSTYNGSTPTYTDSNGTQWTVYLNAAGNETGDDWVKTNGTRGNDTYNSGGSSSGVTYNPDGTYSTYQNDGQGNQDTEYYNAAGTLTGDAESNSDGSHGYDNYYANGSSSGTYYNANGSYTAYSDDGQGNTTDSNFSASGVLVSSQWSEANGTYGDETISAGTTMGDEYFTGGSYSTFTIDATGNNVTQNFDSNGNLVTTAESLVNGAGDTDTYLFDNAGDLIQDSQTLTSGRTVTQTVGTSSAMSLTNFTVDSSNGNTLVVPDTGGIVLAWGAGDTVSAGSGTALIDAWGSDDSIVGGSGNDTLDAMGSYATLIGGIGNETFGINDATDVVRAQAGAASNEILSSVSYTLPTAVDTLTLTGSANLTAHGNFDAANLITGNTGNDTLFAGSGADTLVSGSGIDTLEGGAGRDTFVINNSADVIEVNYYGTDTVESSVSYVLNAPVYTMNLTGSANITATDDSGYATITGNAGNDTLIGGYGDDELIAGSGIDTFVAGTGRTTFVLNNAADVIEGLSSSDQDTVKSSASYSLASGADTLILTGSANVSGAGNDDATNSITGNAGNDTLAAGSGSDTLNAGTGIDTLIAGTGSDSLFGNAGDTYVVNSGFGNVEISQGSGTGTLQFGAGITAADLQLSMTTGSDGNPALVIQDGSGSVTIDDGLSGTIGSFEFADGSDLSFGQLASEATVTPSTIASGNASIILDGAAGDSIDGGIGNDTIYALGANDTLVAGSGNQQLYGFGANDLLIGSTGDDGLHGGSGNDTLVAGPGNSALYGGSATDSYILTEGGTSTLVPSSVAGQAQIIYLPQGMTLSDFTSYPDASGDLILQSLSGDTTAIVKGFYDGGSANKAWLITSDTDTPQFLGHWAGTQQETGSAYAQEIAGLQQSYAAQLKVTLNQLGEDGYALSAEDANGDYVPRGPSDPPYYFYQFNGVTEQSVTVSGGTYNAGSEESDQIQTTNQTQLVTQTIETPIYSTVTTPEQTWFVPVGDTPTDQLNDYNNNVQTATVDGQQGEYINIPSEVYTSITGYRATTETIEEGTTTVNLTRSFNVTNITGDGGNDVITATPQYVGSINTGDGNVSVNLGYYDGVIGEVHSQENYEYYNTYAQGAFIQAGSGNDTLIGSGGEDTIAAGTGFDYMEGGLGTTYYVPMEGDSTTVIGDPASPYGEGPFPLTKLVLPTSITPSNLTYRVFQDAATGSEVLQLRDGNSSVLVYFGPIYQANDVGNNTDNASPGVNLFQFADGTVLTRAQLLAQATLLPNDFNPQVSVDTQNLTAGEEVSANGFFSATDASDDPITWYRVTNSGEGGAYFTLDGKAQATGQPFYVSAGQLSQLTYVAGAGDSTDSIQVSAFDGAIWSTSQTLTISPTGSSDNTFTATGANQLVTGATTAPDTLVGGYAGDTLVGASSQDTFLYAAGSGAETISESAPITSSSNNTLQFGSGITPGMVSLAVTNGDLELQIGTNGDAIQIAGFNPTDPLNSVAIQNFSFSNGTSLSLAELLAQVPAGSGTINYSDGSYTNYTIDPTGTQPYTAETVTGPGDPLSQYTLNSDGSTEADTWTWAPDGSFVYTEISTPGDTWAGTKLVQDYNAENQAQSQVITLSDGTTETFAWTYATDGSITQTEVTTPGDGSPSSETIQDYNPSGQLVTQLQDNADGSTDADTYTYGSDGSIVVTDVHTPAGGGATNTVTQDFNPQGQIVGQQNLNADGSTDATVWTYNSDGSYSESDVYTPASGSGSTTTVQTYNSDNQFTGQNGYALQANGSYTDAWYKTDGSQGTYWWNASTSEYQETWQNADGSTFTDDYQYASGGSPGSTNVSFTETYSDSNGDEGTRQYNAATGVTTVTWDSPQTGSISGTTTNDSGFIGLQLQGELTNTVNDPSYFNPATSPVFTAFLAAHG